MSFIRPLRATLQNSARARYTLYATAAVGTYYGVWKWHEGQRIQHKALENAHGHGHERGEMGKDTLHVKKEKLKDSIEHHKLSENSHAPPSPDLSQKQEALHPPASNDETQPSSSAQPVGEGEGEGESANTGAFDPVTGEINWDCPCLGGMAHGPCGPEFREAFSCFVYSEADPKGIDCVEKFRGMQDCFRAHPEVYAEELRDDADPEDLDSVDTPEGGEVIANQTPSPSSPAPSGGEGLPLPPKPSPSPPPEGIKIPQGPPPLPTPENPSPQPPPTPPSEGPKQPPLTPRGDPRKHPPALPRPKPRGTRIVDPLPSPDGVKTSVTSTGEGVAALTGGEKEA